MYKPTPFHERTTAHCESLRWKQWAGYYTVNSYGGCHEREYQAFRQAVGVIDVTPLFKYEVTGKDAAKFLARVIAKDITKLKTNQVTYCCWCDEEGKIIDDGTVWKFDDETYFLTAAEPSLYWFDKYKRGYDIEMTDVTGNYGALAVQGPMSRDVINEICDVELSDLKFFYLVSCKIGGMDVVITRTGYTGDLGYEIWIKSENGVKLWDILFEAGKSYGIAACGMESMDLTRVEAGFIMNGIDYYSANHCMIERRKSTPYELGLGWSVNLDRAPFIGQKALKAEKEKGPARKMVGLEIDWLEFEALFLEYELPPEPPAGAWREGVPVYDQAHQQIGFATSGAWSPILKKNLALAHIEPSFAKLGTKILFEVTVEYERRTVTATVVKTPFFNPKRKRS